jgi:hypothetical protein
MSVDVLALYTALLRRCAQAEDGVYECDERQFSMETGYHSFRALSPLITNGSIKASTLDGLVYHITIKEASR